MRKVKKTPDKSSPYRNLGLDMVKAPVKLTNQPKSGRTIAKEDLRSKGGK